MSDAAGLSSPALHRRGRPLGADAIPVVLLHGRGRDPADMFGMVEPIGDDDVAWLAPEAPGGTWYPNSFLAPVEDNQPDLDRAVAVVEAIVTDLVAAGHPAERIVLIGFSQGACLVAEHALRHPRRYGGLVIWTGGDVSDPAPLGGGSLAGTPVYLANSDVDDWVPEARSAATAERLRRRGAEVVYEVRPGMPHVVEPEEVAAAAAIIDRVRQRT